MINWDVFLPFAVVSVILWGIGAVAAFRKSEGCSRASVVCTLAGIVVYAVFVDCVQVFPVGCGALVEWRLIL